MNPDDVNVTARPLFLADQSDTSAQRYVFSYRIDIANGSDETLLLLSRYWLITHGSGRVEEVSGDGVVGQQPEIAPGETHRYSSGAILESPVGTMEGHYLMRRPDGRKVKVRIPRFRLSMPGVIH
ncbi:MAG: Co2+/Mg2+ efflux protein ApaG [Pseudomonadota bacterium]